MSENDQPGVSHSGQERSPVRHRLLIVLLAVALVRGLLYLAITPPWEHYDEPTHFEYVRLIAERGRLPRPGDYDPQMQRDIAASMKAAGFWKERGEPAFPLQSDSPLNLGYSQLTHPPLYYALLALPQALVAHRSVETQLYLARLCSVALSLVAVAAAYGLLTEVFPRPSWLPLAAATFIVWLPPFTDFMSAVNNDVGAIVASTLLLWASVRLIRRGPSLRRAAAVLLFSGVCIVTKNTSAIVAVTSLLALGWLHIPSPWRRWLGAGLVLLGLVALPLTLTWGRHAAHWYSSYQPAATNRAEVGTPLGRSALVLSASGDRYPATIVQELRPADGRALRGHTVTFGAWLRAAEGSGKPIILNLVDGTTNYGQEVPGTTEWQFQTLTATIGLEAPTVAAYLSIPYSPGAVQTVYADGVVLADGQLPAGVPPCFDTARAETGQWDGQVFTNLLRNGSAEYAWPGLRPWIGQRTLHRNPLAMIFHSAWDVSRNLEAYGNEAEYLFRNFWGRFGWSHLQLPRTYFYGLGLISAAGAIGVIVGLVRCSRSSSGPEPWQRRAWLVLGFVWLVSWGATVLRIHPVFYVVRSFQLPVARYAAVAIAITGALLCFGLAEILPRRWIREAAFAGLLGLIVLDAVALWQVIVPYYYG